jgi:phage baseplate assembly protein W
MPSLNFTGLQKLQLTTNNYTYSDLHLDLDNPISRDISTDYDETAVKNSILNLFNTIPGQNLLNPEYGLNLARFLFDPLTETNGRVIGDTILTGLTRYEPRIVIRDIEIEIDEIEQTYYIVLNIEIPILSSTLRIPGTLSKTGFTLS